MENRNQRRTREQWQALAAQFATSSLSHEQFCQQHGLGEKTFHNWRLRLNREAQSPSFVPVTAHSTALQEHHGDAIVIRSGEVMIELPVMVGMGAVSELVRALRDVG